MLFKSLKTKTCEIISKVWKRHDIFITIFVIAFSLRVFVAVWSGYRGTDIKYHLNASRGLLEGLALYRDLRFDYPPLHAYFQAFFLKTLGDNALAAKMPAILGDLAFAWLLYLLGSRNKAEYGRKLSLCYLLFPLSVLSSNWFGLFDSVSLFLMAAAIYYSLKGQDFLAAVFIGVGTMYKWFPLLALIPIIFGEIADRKVKKILLYGIVVGTICLSVSLPFLLIDKEKTVYYYLYNSRKLPDSFSVFRIFPISSENLPFIVQVVAVFVLFYVIVYKHKVFDVKSVEGITFFAALFILLNKNLYPHYFLWVFPFIAYWYVCNDELLKLVFVLLVNTPLLGLFWFRNGEYVNSSIALPLIFHVFNWAVICYTVLKRVKK
jgi:4-amino-4-deoxy-L-arabinose transferase-like glycosyltransferase